ncbi:MULTISPECIES: DUF222 domain-containing protein [unclassified Brachybacterium]|uniref:HNH endonuclease n=1 Tax=unclassified Brachybacterium TaxID=2623841 RepID=UPI00360FB8A4
MEHTSSSSSGEADGHDARPGETPPGGRAQAGPERGAQLRDVARRLARFEGHDEAGSLVAEVVDAALQAFTRTTSVRDPLPSTVPGTPQEALAVLAGLDQLRSALSAIDARWQVEAEARIRAADRDADVDEDQQGRSAAHEIGLARRVSPSSASLSLGSSRRLVEQLPGVASALRDGDVTQQQVAALSGALDGAEPATCARIDEIVSEDPQSLQGMGPRRVRRGVQEIIQRMEPHNSRARAERAARARHVRMTPLSDGMARVTGILRGVDASGMMQTLNRGAQSLKAGGARESVSALEADLLVAAVQDGPGSDRAEPGVTQEGDAPFRKPSRPAQGLDVGVIITDTALLGRDDEAQCAQLEGYGAIPAHIITDTLRGTPPGYLRGSEDKHPDEDVTAFYRRLYTNPTTGELTGMESRARVFPAGLARMIRWRDVTCRTPWCNAIIRQIDHARPHHQGGPTSYANGQGLCVRCNLLKEHGRWVLTPLTSTDPAATGRAPTTADPTDPTAPAATDPRGWAWQSPHGAHATSRTPRLLDPPAPREAGAARDEPFPSESAPFPFDSAVPDAHQARPLGAEPPDDPVPPPRRRPGR